MQRRRWQQLPAAAGPAPHLSAEAPRHGASRRPGAADDAL